MIKIEKLCKDFGALRVLKNIDLHINKHDIVAIIGPSGSGKSTLLRCINKLELASSGKIIINGQNILEDGVNINEIRKKISMVFQHFNLFNNKNILENLILAPVNTKLLSQKEAILKARALLDRINLLDKEKVYPAKLSGGQKQRIAIARSLMMNPQLILFDEPTSALDPEMIGEVLSIMRDIANDGMSMMVVTHEMGFAKNVSNRLLFMDAGEVLVDACPKEVFKNPKDARLKSFLDKVLNH